MAGQILSLFARPRNRDWSQQELAEFYRVESALVRSGLSVETDRGLTDEGEPWFVFCRSSDGEVVVHFAKCDGHYIVAGPAYERVAKGLDFSSLVRDLVSRHPLVNTKARPGSNVVLHPTALLVAVVAAALLKDGEAQAKGIEPEGCTRNREAPGETGGSWFSNVGLSSSITIDVRHLAVVMSAIAVTLPITETDSGSISHDRSLLLADRSNIEQGRESASGHAYGIDLSLHEEGARAATSQNFSHAIISPEQKLEVLSFTSILLDLSAKESKSAEVLNHELALGDDVVQELAVPNLAPHSELFLRIELIKGSSELPSIQAVAHHSGDETAAIPINLASIQPFLDHALHLKGAANSALDVLEALTNQGTIQQSLFNSVKNDLSQAELTSTPSTPATDGAASVPSEHTATDQPHALADYHLPPEGHAVDAQSIARWIEAFVREEGNFKILQDGNDIIFCSTQTLSASENMVRSVTWDFSDGSSITLIGPPSHLPMELMA